MNPEYRDRDRIKSYATRAFRMSHHQREAYERLRDRYCVSRSPTPVAPDSLFPSPAPVVLEIGFGMGRATAEIARARPDWNYLGVEVYTPGVGKLLALIEEHALTNVRIIHDDAILVLDDMIPSDSLAGIHLFFPDPWPKKRHYKRRIVRPALAAVMADRIAPGGYLFMVTDWQEYALSARDVLDDTCLIDRSQSARDRLAWRPQTAFERKGLASGREIAELYYTKPEKRV
ncbi:MAG: tRNA (guanosine(46)-N7)-methyltransferase TrmB [Spirochaetaceae bacterium]|nr:MAG: tRNA (guanosine(46)-N7)-methyltransferase TrmB [Spirochaetaceae bacterium]